MQRHFKIFFRNDLNDIYTLCLLCATTVVNTKCLSTSSLKHQSPFEAIWLAVSLSPTSDLFLCYATDLIKANTPFCCKLPFYNWLATDKWYLQFSSPGLKFQIKRLIVDQSRSGSYCNTCLNQEKSPSFILKISTFAENYTFWFLDVFWMTRRSIFVFFLGHSWTGNNVMNHSCLLLTTCKVFCSYLSFCTKTSQVYTYQLIFLCSSIVVTLLEILSSKTGNHFTDLQSGKTKYFWKEKLVLVFFLQTYLPAQLKGNDIKQQRDV